MVGLIIIIVVVVILVLIAISTYNGLVRIRNRVDNAWAQIDVQLKRRHDLIPNLIETVKGYAAHERETLDSVVQARNQAVSANRLSSRAKPRTCSRRPSAGCSPSRRPTRT